MPIETDQMSSDFVRFMSFVKIPADRNACWVWQGKRERERYGHFTVKGHEYQAHRWIFTLLHGAIPDGLVIRHHCDNPSCVNPQHLASGTHSQNVMDAIQRGRRSNRKGEKHPLAVLDAIKVLEIRQLAACGHPQHRIAETYGISRQQVGKIARRENWGHI